VTLESFGEIEKKAPVDFPSLLLFLLKVKKNIIKIIPPKPLAFLTRFSVKFFAKRFIAGETIETSLETIEGLKNDGRSATLDYLGELVVSRAEAKKYQEMVLSLIKGLPNNSSKNKAGILHSHVSLKVSALCADFRPWAKDLVKKEMKENLSLIFSEAKKRNVFLNVDAEHREHRDIVFEVFQEVLLENKEFHNFPHVGIVVQGYHRDAKKHLDDVLELARKRKIIMPIRLVKGAYWDAETVHAKAHNVCAPQFLNKVETDLYFRMLVCEILKQGELLQLCLASHNLEDHLYGEEIRQQFFSSSPIIEHQCLHQTHESLSRAMASWGFAVRNYVPVGPLLTGMAYLVRRIMENSSQVGVLAKGRQKNSHGGARPFLRETYKKDFPNPHLWDLEPLSYKTTEKFFNVPPLLPYEDQKGEAFLKPFFSSKKNLAASLSKKWNIPFEKEGKAIISPSNFSLVLGKLKEEKGEEVLEKIQKSHEYFKTGSWAQGPQWVRSLVLHQTAILMLLQREDLARLIGLEAGKAIPEALGDVDEAIDFLHFYAEKSYELSERKKSFLPRGVTVVISPWNFPLAIACGMVSGALSMGNTVVLKSANHTPLVAMAFVDLFQRSLKMTGLFREEFVLQHVFGRGSELGPILTKNELVASLVFTGSKEVGTKIYFDSMKRSYFHEALGKKILPRVITEMGGKNAILVTNTAEMDETVSGVLYSSLGHAGQKCSAASRILVAREIFTIFKERFSEAVRDISLGLSFESHTYVNPLVSEGEKILMLKKMELAKAEVLKAGGEVLVDRSDEGMENTSLVGPLLLAAPKELGFEKDSWTHREFFGPVIHLIPFDGLEEGIKLFNATEYALTGGIFSQSGEQIEHLLSVLECGNLYVNRGCTGARVGVEPFGGFKMSGTGPKAGHYDYLKSFIVEKDPFSEAAPLDIYEKNSQFPDRRDKKIEHFLSICKEHSLVSEKSLSQFTQWIKSDEFLQSLGRIHNLRIPGQLSYNDYSLLKKSPLFITGKNELSEKNLFFIWLTYFTHGGMSLYHIGDYEECHTWEHFKKLGENFKIFKSDLTRLPKLLGHESDFMVFDGTLEDLIGFNKSFFCDSDMAYFSGLPRIVHTDELGSSFQEMAQSLVNVRSVAQNVMRHGAPLQ
jgi:RHH-type proline utilization regulon transcriptional repressor/proline dehydrogenase/delta 1-pyrroline-5-carboxylate dehydrogenase